MKKIFSVLICLVLIITSPYVCYGYPLSVDKPMATKSQVVQFLEDRNATKDFLDCVDFIYSYCEEVHIDPTIVIAISSLETGYGKSNLFRNYNNPGGIKARGGWRRFDTLKDGYRGMINLLAIYSGNLKSNSWIFNKAHTTQDLGNYYWVENGCDHGYHDMLTIVINKMLSYESLEKEEPVVKTPEESPKKESAKKKIESIRNKKRTPLDIIKDILKNKKHMNSMDLIKNALKK